MDTTTILCAFYNVRIYCNTSLWGNKCSWLIGEVTAHVIVEDKEQEIISIKDVGNKKVQTAKGINILNIWFELLITVVCISFCANLMKLPRGDTIVTLKVRMAD